MSNYMQHKCRCKKLSVIKDKSIYYCVNCWLKTRFIYFKKEIQNEYRI